MALFDNLNRKKTGILPYLLLLILAIIILFFISYTSFKMNRALRQSTEQVSRTQEIINEINMLFGNYTGSESAGIKYLISKDSSYLSPIIGYHNKSDMSLKRLRRLTTNNPEQQELLNRVPQLSAELFRELKILDSKVAEKITVSGALSNKIQSIEQHLDSLENIKTEMIAEEYELLKQRKAAYESQMTLTPINILYLSLFTLGSLMFAYSRINSDRKKIGATQNFLQNILENTDNVVHYLVPLHEAEKDEAIDFKVTYVNSKIEAITGRSASNTVNNKLSDIYPFTVAKGLIGVLNDTMERGRPQSREVDYEINGERIWFLSTFAPTHDGITVTSRDITATKEAELNLHQLNKRLESQNLELERTGSFLQNMLSSLQYIISYFEAVRDGDGNIKDFKISYINDKIKDLTGRSAEESTGKLASEEYPFLLNYGDFETYMKVIASGKSKEVEREYHLPKGHFYFCNEILKLGDGVTIVSQDITLRKKAENKLNIANERLALQNMVLNDAEYVAGVGSFSYNLSTETLTYSDNCFRLLGMEPSEKIPSLDLITSLIHPADRKRFEKNVRSTLKERKTVRIEYRLKLHDGKLKNILMQGHFFEKNEEPFMVGVIRDITQEIANEITLQRRNRELERTNAELESFNRVVSHDLQEPLRKIQMFISRMSHTDLQGLSEKGKKYLKKVDQSANRMQLLIRNLLSYARLTEEVESHGPVDLNEVFEKVLDDLSEKIKETGAKIYIPDLPRINGIEFQLEQLFSNLLSNALKYKKHDSVPEITVSTEILPPRIMNEALNPSMSKYLLVTMTDNGIGFDSKQDVKVFQLFQRLHKKHAYEGTGLGLAICKKIVENHNGHIVAKSEPGKGTRMQVYFPYKKSKLMPSN
ncbi:ATP-binding protein [Pricia sp. S334]|uniref:histidine kinase n=1 Tax=Pricia mediterranea TaxID=3076079 RepID=A0ABU3L234_9FLAO|nr:ATP-binding protein [Pricia sp. S334]MDT7827795.1 ATP-binding protein [Pricia sp. S334]